MNGLYIALCCSVAAVTLAAALLNVGRWSGRQEQHLKEQDEHLARQDQQIAELHSKLDKLQP